MDVFIAICCDHRDDETVRVFSAVKSAVSFCKEFASSEELEEQELTEEMVEAGWLYYATYGTEGDSVRVEKGKLDPQE